jgi:CheY-like chemotaxis protein
VSEFKAHLVDDDEAIRDALAWLLRSRNIAAVAYSDGADFLAAYTGETAATRGARAPCGQALRAVCGIALFSKGG